MTEELPGSVERAFDRHDTFQRADSQASERDGDRAGAGVERAADIGYRAETTVFDARVTAVGASGGDVVYSVAVRVPTLDEATVEGVGDAVAAGWFETFERRLADAPKATRADVELRRLDVERDGGEVVVTFGFEWSDPDRAADIAKALVEYVEGTYVEGVIPGYEYVSPVADLVESASHEGGGGGGTPL
jgi:hypothetical protein